MRQKTDNGEAMLHSLRALQFANSLSLKVFEVSIPGDTDKSKERGQVEQGPYLPSSQVSAKKGKSDGNRQSG